MLAASRDEATERSSTWQGVAVARGGGSRPPRRRRRRRRSPRPDRGAGRTRGRDAPRPARGTGSGRTRRSRIRRRRAATAGSNPSVGQLGDERLEARGVLRPWSAASARPWARPASAASSAPTPGRRRQLQEHPRQHRERRRLEPERRARRRRASRGAAGDRRRRGPRCDLEQADVAHALEVGPHGVGVQAERLGDVGGRQRERRTGQLEVDRVAGVVAERLQHVEATGRADISHTERLHGRRPVECHGPVTAPSLRPTTSPACSAASSTPSWAATSSSWAWSRHRHRPPTVTCRGHHRRSRPPAARCGPRSRSDVRARVGSPPGVAQVKHRLDRDDAEEKSRRPWPRRAGTSASTPRDTAIPTTRVMTIASGKGGVGKSSVTVNLAAALAPAGLHGRRARRRHLGVLRPAHARRRRSARRHQGGRRQEDRPQRASTSAPGSLEIVSMGFLVEDEEHRPDVAGPHAQPGGAALPRRTSRGVDLDYLLIDMPPGTGDVQMGLARMLPRAEMIIVTTPAVSAQKVAVRAVNMARKSYLRIAGVIENMSAFTCEHGETLRPVRRGRRPDPRRRRRRPAARPGPARAVGGRRR